MNVIGNNIANINTTGFKDASVQFADQFSNALVASSGNAIQVGAGVYDQAITNNWSAGALNSTGITSDLAINGNGFFVVADPTSGTQYVTQDGAFSVDANGYLVTAGGQRVQGVETAGGALGSLQIAPTAAELAATPGLSVSSYTINSQGQINITLSDGTTSANAPQIYLQNFSDPSALISETGNLYSNQTAAGASAIGAPGASGTGTIVSGSLELSNVDLSSEMANLITAQRGFEANSKVVTTSDQMLQTVVNMVQG
jgi:flagellar hook protein FlgE